MFFFFFFNDPAPPEIYPLPLHDALPISPGGLLGRRGARLHALRPPLQPDGRARPRALRSEEHTSELQSRSDLVCRLLLEKKKCCDATVHRTPYISRYHISPRRS